MARINRALCSPKRLGQIRFRQLHQKGFRIRAAAERQFEVGGQEQVGRGAVCASQAFGHVIQQNLRPRISDGLREGRSNR